MSIRIGKLLLVAAILVVTIPEAIYMWAQTRSISSVLAALAVTLFLCALLVRSAFKPRDPLVPPSKGWRLFWIVIGALCFMSIWGNLIGPRDRPQRSVDVGGLKISLDPCVEGAMRIFANESERVSYCTCIATTLGGDSLVVGQYKRKLEAGQLSQVVEALLSSGEVDVAQLRACMSDRPSVRWTDTMLERVKSDCVKSMKVDSSYALYDVEKHCDCMTSKVAQRSPSFLLDEAQAPDLAKMQEDCASLSME